MMIYGTAWKKENTTSLVSQAISNGFRAIDTACQPKHYDEKRVGDGVIGALEKQNLKREEIFLQTKFTPYPGQDPNNIPYNPNDTIEQQIQTSLDVSLKNLQTSYIDSLLLHSPISPYSELLKAWKLFESFVKEGKVKQIGISNCYDIELFKSIYKDANIKPKVLQNRFYAQSNYDRELREFCKENNVNYQSFWSLTANINTLNNKEFIDICKIHKKTQAQIFYRFLIDIGITPLNGTTSEVHMKEDLEVDNFTLNESDLKTIENLLYD